MALLWKAAVQDEDEVTQPLADKWWELVESGNKDDADEAWKEYSEATKEHWKRKEKAKDEACDMLKACFFDLWD